MNTECLDFITSVDLRAISLCGRDVIKKTHTQNISNDSEIKQTLKIKCGCNRHHIALFQMLMFISF